MAISAEFHGQRRLTLPVAIAQIKIRHRSRYSQAEASYQGPCTELTLLGERKVPAKTRFKLGSSPAAQVVGGLILSLHKKIEKVSSAN